MFTVIDIDFSGKTGVVVVLIVTPFVVVVLGDVLVDVVILGVFEDCVISLGLSRVLGLTIVMILYRDLNGDFPFHDSQVCCQLSNL